MKLAFNFKTNNIDFFSLLFVMSNIIKEFTQRSSPALRTKGQKIAFDSKTPSNSCKMVSRKMGLLL